MKKVLILLVVCLLTSSCGVKGDLDKPEGAKYKRTYPAF
jgi:uncharacterized protein YceK